MLITIYINCNAYASRDLNLPRESSERARATPAQPKRSLRSRALAFRAYLIGLATRKMPVIPRSCLSFPPNHGSHLSVCYRAVHNVRSCTRVSPSSRRSVFLYFACVYSGGADLCVCKREKECEPAQRVPRARQEASKEPAASQPVDHSERARARERERGS